MSMGIIPGNINTRCYLYLLDGERTTKMDPSISKWWVSVPQTVLTISYSNNHLLQYCVLVQGFYEMYAFSCRDSSHSVLLSSVFVEFSFTSVLLSVLWNLATDQYSQCIVEFSFTSVVLSVLWNLATHQ